MSTLAELQNELAATGSITIGDYLLTEDDYAGLASGLQSLAEEQQAIRDDWAEQGEDVDLADLDISLHDLARHVGPWLEGVLYTGDLPEDGLDDLARRAQRTLDLDLHMGRCSDESATNALRARGTLAAIERARSERKAA
ncbi:hypothetical protein [Corynebacterium sp.]|uniref:hypothetical protein n=1 Tax=Corynebacterium sp. TaxID=1720 RepID=UPI002904A93E|nr:hypothetical protein [Corynebacterium sp.]MDU3109972.1 hypothetical protein [Corynebacterium sp.]